MWMLRQFVLKQRIAEPINAWHAQKRRFAFWWDLWEEKCFSFHRRFWCMWSKWVNNLCELVAKKKLAKFFDKFKNRIKIAGKKGFKLQMTNWFFSFPRLFSLVVWVQLTNKRFLFLLKFKFTIKWFKCHTHKRMRDVLSCFPWRAIGFISRSVESVDWKFRLLGMVCFVKVWRE